MTDCICANKELVASCVHPYCPEHGYDEDKERSCRIGEAVLSVLRDFGWDRAVLRADIESGRLADTVEGCVMLAIERALRGGS